MPKLFFNDNFLQISIGTVKIILKKAKLFRKHIIFRERIFEVIDIVFDVQLFWLFKGQNYIWKTLLSMPIF